MYNTSRLFKPTKQDVLELISEYDIYVNHLGYHPIVGKIYTSPFRKDLNPSFGLFRARNNNILFKDFGLNESGDVFKFIKLLEHKSTQEVIQDLFNNYQKKSPKKPSEIPEIKTGTKEIYAHHIPFTIAGLQYWQTYGISFKTLVKFNVHQIDKFWINGRLSGYTTTEKPMFTYEIYNKDKIYRPFNRNDRFRTNCSSLDIQGFEQLDYSKDTVIITKSLKDVMYLHELGYTAIAPNGEGHTIPTKIIDILKKNFKYIIMFYDWDTAGVLSTRKLVKQNPSFGFIFTNQKMAKDITDYHKLNGLAETKKFISKALNYAKRKHFNNQP